MWTTRQITVDLFILTKEISKTKNYFVQSVINLVPLLKSGVICASFITLKEWIKDNLISYIVSAIIIKPNKRFIKRKQCMSIS